MDEITCLEAGPDCRGAVRMRPTPPEGMRSFPRCQYHGDRRWERYEGSLEAQSPFAPSWFDPSYAGERWDDEY